MARSLTEATLSTPNARSKLGPGVYWRGLNADVHLGYRKGKRSGRWLVRWYLGDQKYTQEGIGAADDAVKANGVDCLTFEQAKSKASARVAERKAEARAQAAGPVPTVRSVVLAYLDGRDARDAALTSGRKRDARRRLTRHVLSHRIADKQLFALRETDLIGWRTGLPVHLAPATVSRLGNDFKAALNAGAAKHRDALPAEIVLIVKNGLKSEHSEPSVARDKQALPDAEVRRIIEAARSVDDEDQWEGDLLRMIVVLASTGARFSQTARMSVGDVQADQGRLMVPTSRKGRGKKKASHIAVRVGADVIEALLPAVAGRRAGETLLERWRHKQVPAQGDIPSHWTREGRGPWRNATEVARSWAKILIKIGLPKDVVPYALRHSSIVRQLRAGLPVRLVAALHDTSSAIIERHYAAAIVDALDALSAGAVIPLVSNETDSKVVRPTRWAGTT